MINPGEGRKKKKEEIKGKEIGQVETSIRMST